MIEVPAGPSKTFEPTRPLFDSAIRLGLVALLVYWSFIIVRPFIAIMVWSAVLAVALYPAFRWMAARLGGRRGMAAALITILSLLIIVGPATWLGLGLIESLRDLSDRLQSGTLPVPPPPDAIRRWPLIGQPIHEFWDQASTNLKSALATVFPLLKPLGSTALSLAADTGVGVLKFLVAVVIAGFLLPPGPALVQALKAFSVRVASARGEQLVELAGATIRTVSRGVIGVALLQAILVGIGLLAAGVPGASLIALAVMVLGIVQIGAAPVLIPVIIWGWTTMAPTAALMFTAYMLVVGLVDNILRPILIGRGLTTPIVVIFIGVVGGTVTQGILGLFLGPIVLAVAWQLLVAWMRNDATV